MRILDVGEPAISVLSIAQHPGRTHLILGGCSDGNLTLWDVRKSTDEPLVVARHDGAILDVSDELNPDQRIIYDCFAYAYL